MQAEGPNRRFRSFSTNSAGPIDLVIRSANVSAPDHAHLLGVFAGASEIARPADPPRRHVTTPSLDLAIPRHTERKGRVNETL